MQKLKVSSNSANYAKLTPHVKDVQGWQPKSTCLRDALLAMVWVHKRALKPVTTSNTQSIEIAKKPVQNTLFSCSSWILTDVFAQITRKSLMLDHWWLNRFLPR